MRRARARADPLVATQTDPVFIFFEQNIYILNL